jgi:dolichol-phosphate mannosyltransferase
VKTTVVVPTYNERENLPALVEALHGVDESYSILVVDDESPDGTGVLADEIAARDDRVSVLHRSGPRGLGRAYRDGFARALSGEDGESGADVIVQMDCDFSHDPASVPRLLRAIERADLVLGSRYCRGGGTRNWGLGRKLLSRGGSFYARLWLGVPANDLTGGFKAWRRDLMARMPLDRIRSDGYGFQVEMSWRAHRLGARIREVPILFEDRRIGQSKMSGSIVREAVLMVPKLALGLLS